MFLPYPSHFILSHCQPLIPIFYSAATLQFFPIHLNQLFPKQFPIRIYVLIHFPTELFSHVLFVLINTPFNLSLFFF